jgi:recombination protein RecA
MSSSVLHAALPSPLLPLETPLSEPGRSRLLRLPRGVVPGSQLEVRPAPATVPSGIIQIDALTGGLPRGALTEIFGPASSGRTGLVLTALADATRRQEVCALVDAGDNLHPESAAAAGLDLQRVLWIRCGENSPPQKHRGTEAIGDFKIEDCRLKNQNLTSSPQINADQRGPESIHESLIINRQTVRNSKLETRNFAENWQRTTNNCVSNRQSSIINRQSRSWDHRLEQVLKTTDLLLQSGGFGMVVVDLADVPPRFARRIPLASWFRFRRAVENTPTVLLVVEQEPYAKTCASLVLKMQLAALEKQRSAFADQHSAISTQHSAQVAFVQKHPVQCEETPKQPFFSHHSPAHAQILRGVPVEAEIVHARLQRKPVHSAAQFHTRTAWAKSLAG